MSMKWLTADWSRRRGSRAARALAAGAVALALAGCGLAPQSNDAELLDLIAPPNISKKPEFTVAKSVIESKVSATGRLMSEEQQSIYFQTDNGQITDIRVQPGEQVSKGQIIAVIDTGNLEKQMQRKEIEVRQAELNLIDKMREDSRSPIQQELDKLNFELLVGELDEMKEQLEASRLKAPLDGTLVSFSKKIGDTVKAYEAIGTVADLNRLTVAARFSNSDLEYIVVGMEAEVSINIAGSFKGKVSRLPLATANSSSDDSLDAYALIELDEPPVDLQSGTPLSAAVITERKEDAVLIPPAALRTVSGRNYVQVVDEEGNKREVDVEVGLSTATEVEIVKGLEPGQRVVGK